MKTIAIAKTQPAHQPDRPLSPVDYQLINAYWRAANYLSVGQIYLHDNPLLREPLLLAHIKKMLLGHYAGPEFHLCPPEPGDQKV